MALPAGPQSEPLRSEEIPLDLSPNADASSAFPEGPSSSEPQSATGLLGEVQHDERLEESETPKRMYRVPRDVVPGLPRAQTFKRQLSEQRSRLAPVELGPEERRAMSMDRRHRTTAMDASHPFTIDSHIDQLYHDGIYDQHDPLFLPTFSTKQEHHLSTEAYSEASDDRHDSDDMESSRYTRDDHDDTRSVASSRGEFGFENQIQEELETKWILNLSMRYKDHTDREKFFVTYRQDDYDWRRVTVTLDYRNAPENSLEMELRYTKMQRDKSRKIYEAIRESLKEIKFYKTVTNLKLETLDDRLHVHVVEDANEIIQYPSVRQVEHLGCRRIKERDLSFDHHMSGFVYKVTVRGESLIKKEIPGPDTIEEFLYEINALNSLAYSDHVIKFYGLVVDDHDEYVKGLLISYADGGALVDVIYDNCKDKNLGIEWPLKEKWARQIVHGLADVHESGFVQGDFTLSNIVVDERDNAKIIDINRRGCPVGWEPPEATPLIESHHRISMYIGVKSDLFQLGMVLWALAMEEDEPEREGRPLSFHEKDQVPEWYQRITLICLNADPRKRAQASSLLELFPDEPTPVLDISATQDDSSYITALPELYPDGHMRERTRGVSYDWWTNGQVYTPAGPPAHESWHYPQRGRSPPSPLPSHFGDACESNRQFHSHPTWSAHGGIRASYSDTGDSVRFDDVAQQLGAFASLGPLPSSHDMIQIDDEQHGQETSRSAEDSNDNQASTSSSATNVVDKANHTRQVDDTEANQTTTVLDSDLAIGPKPDVDTGVSSVINTAPHVTLESTESMSSAQPFEASFPSTGALDSDNPKAVEKPQKLVNTAPIDTVLIENVTSVHCDGTRASRDDEHARDIDLPLYASEGLYLQSHSAHWLLCNNTHADIPAILVEGDSDEEDIEVIPESIESRETSLANRAPNKSHTTCMVDGPIQPSLDLSSNCYQILSSHWLIHDFARKPPGELHQSESSILTDAGIETHVKPTDQCLAESNLPENDVPEPSGSIEMETGDSDMASKGAIGVHGGPETHVNIDLPGNTEPDHQSTPNVGRSEPEQASQPRCLTDYQYENGEIGMSAPPQALDRPSWIIPRGGLTNGHCLMGVGDNMNPGQYDDTLDLDEDIPILQTEPTSA